MRTNRDQYHGGIPLDKRTKAIKRFEKEDANVLLASLKCGGVGLNLTAASRVIIVDPWWNYSVDDQAFSRVFRIGQTKKTKLTRFIVRNTVDEAILNMQERKQTEINEVMNDLKGKRKALEVSQLLRLFGPTREDSEGKPFIMVEDYPDIPYVDRDSDDERLGDDA